MNDSWAKVNFLVGDQVKKWNQVKKWKLKQLKKWPWTILKKRISLACPMITKKFLQSSKIMTPKMDPILHLTLVVLKVSFVSKLY